jgi:ribosomal protein S18 acetylase RimI-like enzyme
MRTDVEEQPDNQLLIRRTAEIDSDGLRTLRLQALQQHPELFAVDYETEQAKPAEAWVVQARDSIIYVAVLGKHLIGMAGISQGQTSKTRHKGDLWGVYVQPAHRGQRIGQQLVGTCIEWAQQQGMLYLNLVVGTTNTAAVGCYKKCGFRIYGVEPNCILYQGVLYDEFVMTKEL